MKRFIASFMAATLISTSAFAGGVAEPMMEPEVIAEEASAGSGGFLLPLLALAVLVVLISTDDDPVPPPTKVLSDMRLKEDVVRVGTATNGLPLYHYRYIGQSQVYEGVMAQDVFALDPEAITTHTSGYMLVDYAKLGLSLKLVN